MMHVSIVSKRLCGHHAFMRKSVIAALLVAATPVQGQTFVGPATIVDGDSLSVAGIRLRLFGIDAPEGSQTCRRDGSEWRCGEESAAQLRNLIGANPVECRGRERDVYGRTVAICTVAGIEINRAMVETGWATAFREYSQDYVTDETRAKSARRGIWSSEFQLPQDFRAAQSATVATAGAARPRRQVTDPVAHAGPGCAVKGNRNRKGQWIYHLPGMPSYAITRAEETFCSEAAAQAAGYRRAIVH